MTQRILYIDILKFIAILFVTWGHTMGQFGTHSSFESIATGWRYTLDMPLFAILSGLFFKVPENKSFVELIKKKTLGLIVPNIVWCFLFYVAMHGTYMLIQKILGNPNIYDGNLIWDWWNAMWYEGWWFLRALFFVYVYAIISVYIVRYIIRKANINIDSMCVAGFGSCIVLYLFTLTGIIPNRLPLLLGAIYLYPFVWTGVAIKALDTSIKSHLKSIVVCCFSLWMIGLVFWEGSYTFYGMNTSILAEGGIFGWPILYITVFRYFIGVAASLFVIGFVRILFENKEAGQSKALDYLADIGKYTLFIYIAPSFLFHLVKEQVVFENEFLSFFFCLVCTLVILLVCYLVGKYVVGRWKLTRITLLGMAK